jgi:hypothetical protein
MQRQTQEPINFYVNYRSGIISRRHSSIAAARIEENNASRKGGPPATLYFECGFHQSTVKFHVLTKRHQADSESYKQ